MPPGHGDLYTALYGSGKLDELLNLGVKYMFVNNDDNLQGATLDLDLLTYFADIDAPFMMECAGRTEADKKGGHLAARVTDGQLILRESAQCAEEDEKDFKMYLSIVTLMTNNLWVRLDKQELMEVKGGFVHSAYHFGGKTVDPQNGDQITRFYSSETAMGAALECSLEPKRLFAWTAAPLCPRG